MIFLTQKKWELSELKMINSHSAFIVAVHDRQHFCPTFIWTDVGLITCRACCSGITARLTTFVRVIRSTFLSEITRLQQSVNLSEIQECCGAQTRLHANARCVSALKTMRAERCLSTASLRKRFVMHLLDPVQRSVKHLLDPVQQSPMHHIELSVVCDNQRR